MELVLDPACKQLNQKGLQTISILPCKSPEGKASFVQDHRARWESFWQLQPCGSFKSTRTRRRMEPVLDPAYKQLNQKGLQHQKLKVHYHDKDDNDRTTIDNDNRRS